MLGRVLAEEGSNAEKLCPYGGIKDNVSKKIYDGCIYLYLLSALAHISFSSTSAAFYPTVIAIE